MQEKTEAIQKNIHQIMKDIKTKVLAKHGLGDLHVAEISFSTTAECGPGSKEVCEFLGNDASGRPIIRCSCVPDLEE